MVERISLKVKCVGVFKRYKFSFYATIYLKIEGKQMLKGLTGSGLAWEKFRKYILETAMKCTVLSILHISFLMLSRRNTDSCCFLYLPKVLMVCMGSSMSKRFLMFFRITCIYVQMAGNAVEVAIYSM